MKQLQITVSGKVQGVWFRKYTQEKAVSLNLTGFVMNKPNGTVYIEVEGLKEVLKTFTNWLATTGSPLSNVTNVEITETTFNSNYSSFEIKR